MLKVLSEELHAIEQLYKTLQPAQKMPYQPMPQPEIRVRAADV